MGDKGGGGEIGGVVGGLFFGFGAFGILGALLR